MNMQAYLFTPKTHRKSLSSSSSNHIRMRPSPAAVTWCPSTSQRDSVEQSHFPFILTAPINLSRCVKAEPVRLGTTGSPEILQCRNREALSINRSAWSQRSSWSYLTENPENVSFTTKQCSFGGELHLAGEGGRSNENFGARDRLPLHLASIAKM